MLYVVETLYVTFSVFSVTVKNAKCTVSLKFTSGGPLSNTVDALLLAKCQVYRRHKIKKKEVHLVYTFLKC